MSKPMQPSLDKPKPPKVIVSAVDRENGKSKSTTVYNATPEEVMEILEKAITEAEPAQSVEAGKANSAKASTAAA